MSRLRVLVAEDSLTVRKRIVEALSASPDFEVVGEASDGKQAIEQCQSLRPDVMTLDMMMPVMSGLAATEYIMAYCPTPILIVSASTNRGELFKTYQALAAGAVDVLEKDLGEGGDGDWEARLAGALRVVARVKVITHLKGRQPQPPEAGPLAAVQPGLALRAVAIGASTGGPGAVLALLRGLPKGFPLPILLVVHLTPAFGAAFAEWLDGESPLPVAYAKDGEPLPPSGRGCVRMAPPDSHLSLREGRLRLGQGPERHSCRPSVDVLFESVAAELGSGAVGCLLTGMGRDGAAGLLAMRRSGALTLAQDEASCVVYGMPREAVQLGAASRVLPLDRMAPTLAAALRAGAA
ncbi:MAG TPA: chemotaxis-specific protein-glutamate methyltransferase CheB [bacterium]|jgi:two-component system chemotaxis response regulator CheB|nr:chemotaxis-specific protein-glutamate methyltransferase CheB [bacterium]